MKFITDRLQISLLILHEFNVYYYWNHQKTGWGIEVIKFAKFRLILKARFGDDLWVNVHIHTFRFWFTITLNARSRFWWQKSIWTKFLALHYLLALCEKKVKTRTNINSFKPCEKNIKTLNDIVESKSIYYIASSFKKPPFTFSFEIKN